MISPSELQEHRSEVGRDPCSERPESPAQPCAIVLFGATGDLTKRKLLPALYSLYVQNLLPSPFAIIAVARRERTVDAYRQDALESVRAFAPSVPVSQAAWESFASNIHYVSSSLESPEDYRGLQECLQHVRPAVGSKRIFYLATPPAAFGTVAENLGACGLLRQSVDESSRLVVEKPFGTDLASARDLNRRLRAVLAEDQIYRIDHYLGKETVQNILVLRFANRLFELLWNQLYVDNVQITVSETLGMEGRGAYFDESGILRDIVQNHALQILTLIAMEPPFALDADAVRDEKVKVLRAMRLPSPSDIIRAQYVSGRLGQSEAASYLSEPGVSPRSRTETYCALRLHVDNWRWLGVPFYIRAGKRMAQRVTEVVMELKAVPDVLFTHLKCSEVPPNRITIRIQPDEGVQLLMGAKEPGAGIRVRPVRMRFDYEHEFGIALPDAYERLLLAAMLGDASLFARADEVEVAWSVLAEIMEQWEGELQAPATYVPGSWGPPEADAFLAADGRRWWNPA